MSQVLSKTRVSQLKCLKLNFMKKRNKKEPSNNKLLFSVHFMLMPKDSEIKTVMTQMIMIQPTKFALISNKDFAKKERNVFTHMISLLTELKKSICMLIKELSWSWTQSEENKWANFQKMISINFWEKNNFKWWKEQDPKLSVNSFWKLLKRTNMVGNGIVQMVIFVNTSIVSLQDIDWEKMKKDNQKWKKIKFQSNKE